MTWSVSMSGHDDLSGSEKEEFENELVEKVQALTQELQDTEGCKVTSATVTTNTTGAVSAILE